MEFGKIKRIYDSLQDNTSKKIFEKRLMYSLSGDMKNINDMVLAEMERWGRTDIINRCVEWIKLSGIERVAVFGAGFAGYQIIHALELKGISVVKVYDNDEGRWGGFVHDVIISSPKEIEEEEYLIIGVNAHREEILKQMYSIGVDRKHIFIPDGLWWLGGYPQYFDNEVIKPSEHEVFIDGGSLDGGDSRSFASWCHGNYDHIYAFEPDSANLNRMMATVSKINKFEIYSVGLWNERGVLKFSSGIAENCSVSEDGNISINVDSIDNVLNGRVVTYIKMDIEGSELKALEGAEKTIRKYKPKLAICVYHKPEDIVDIPLKILELHPNFKFYLRHYSYVNTETVLYAICEEHSQVVL